jgi:Zn finger protein HypA/HybF involved in hydrogenase expression
MATYEKQCADCGNIWYDRKSVKDRHTGECPACKSTDVFIRLCAHPKHSSWELSE